MGGSDVPNQTKRPAIDFILKYDRAKNARLCNERLAVMQLKFDKELDMRKLHIWDEEDDKVSKRREKRQKKAAVLAGDDKFKRLTPMMARIHFILRKKCLFLYTTTTLNSSSFYYCWFFFGPLLMLGISVLAILVLFIKDGVEISKKVISCRLDTKVTVFYCTNVVNITLQLLVVVVCNNFFYLFSSESLKSL